jgi:hypothetical protein
MLHFEAVIPTQLILASSYITHVRACSRTVLISRQFFFDYHILDKLKIIGLIAIHSASFHSL